MNVPKAIQGKMFEGRELVTLEDFNVIFGKDMDQHVPICGPSWVLFLEVCRHNREVVAGAEREAIMTSMKAIEELLNDYIR